ncbi:hypothetical protein [Thiosocius teredinicola]|uniref:hypothetical protein n=1 Tax=Thiosocius teredinicola TaxID=1973002 RepID=UPI0009910DFC
MNIDWLNAGSTLIAAAIGGIIAARVATYQTRATLKAEQDGRKQETARELLEAIDSFMHIAYRGEHEERQRHCRRVLTLSALLIPDQFDAIQSRLNYVHLWHRREEGDKPRGIGLTATEGFFAKIKQHLFQTIFGVQFKAVDDRSSDSGHAA